MVQKHTYKKLTWVDVSTPTQEDASALIAEYNIHPIIAEELISATWKPKIDVYENYIYMVLHFPMRTKKDGRYITTEKEIDFVIGKDFIITTKYDEVEPLHNFSKIFEVNSIVDKSDMGEHAGYIFYYMVKKIYKHMGRELEAIRSSLLNAEQRIFEGDEKNMVSVLSNIGREILDFKQITTPHKEVLDSFCDLNSSLFGKHFKLHLDEIKNEFTKIHAAILNNKELLTDLRDTNDSLLSTKQNETMKILTIMAFVTFPLSLITDLFSMNTAHAPIIGYPFDFEIILVIMIAAALIMFGYFKIKKWL